MQSDKEIITGRFLIIGFCSCDKRWFDLMTFDIPEELLERFRLTHVACVAESLVAIQIIHPYAHGGWVRGFKTKEERDSFKFKLEKELDRIAIRGTN